MGYEDNEQEIDLKEMFFYVLYHWRSILMAGLIGALILGAYNGYNTVKSLTSSTATTNEEVVSLDEIETIKNNEAELLKQKNKSVDLIKQINEFEKQIGKEQNSISKQKREIAINQERLKTAQQNMQLEKEKQISLENVLSMATVTYQVSVLGESTGNYRDPADEILACYRKPLSTEPNIIAYAKKYDISKNSVERLYSVSRDMDANRISLVAYGDNDGMASELLDILCDCISDQKKSIIISHELLVVNNECSGLSDSEVIKIKQSNQKKVLDCQEEINKYENAIEAGETAIKDCKNNINYAENSINELQIEMNNCEKESIRLTEENEKISSNIDDHAFSENRIDVEGVIKYVVIGFIAGMFLLFMIHIGVYVFKPVLMTAEDISTMYHYPILGELNKNNNKNCFIDRWIRKAQGLDKRPPNEEVVRIIAATVVSTIDKGSKISVLTSLKENETQTMITNMLEDLVPDMSFILLENGISKASNIFELSESDAVILLEEKCITRIKELYADINRIRLLNKKVLGAIVI